MRFTEKPGEIIRTTGEDDGFWYVRGGPGITEKEVIEEVRAYMLEDEDKYQTADDPPELVARPCWLRWRKVEEGDEVCEDSTHYLDICKTRKPGWAAGWEVWERDALAQTRKIRLLEQRAKAAILKVFPEADRVWASCYAFPRFRVNFRLPGMRFDLDYLSWEEKPYAISSGDLDAWNRLYSGRAVPEVEIPTDEEVMG